MKLLLSLLLCGAMGAGLLRAPDQGAPGPPQGRYLDVRTATVFGGACHIGSERQSQGRNGLLAWQVESGIFAGQDLAGVRMVAALSSTENLAEGGSRRSRLVIDAPTQATARAAEAWLRQSAGTVLGQLEALSMGPVDLLLAGESFSLEVAGFAKVQGRSLPDHACCTMPDQRWYEPFLSVPQVAACLVGFSEAARFEGQGSLPAWRYDGANNALFGSFGLSAGAKSASPAEAEDS